jgi:hypothetical protein
MCPITRGIPFLKILPRVEMGATWSSWMETWKTTFSVLPVKSQSFTVVREAEEPGAGGIA